jgi:hypothetical protein
MPYLRSLRKYSARFQSWVRRWILDSENPIYCWLIGENIVSSWVYLDECLSHAKGCSRCALLLRVIEETRPGWIDAKKSQGGRIDITHREYYQDKEDHPLPSLIELFESPLEGEGADGEKILVQSFTFIYQPHGAYSSLILQLLLC